MPSPCYNCYRPATARSREGAPLCEYDLAGLTAPEPGTQSQPAVASIRKIDAPAPSIDLDDCPRCAWAGGKCEVHVDAA